MRSTVANYKMSKVTLSCSDGNLAVVSLLKNLPVDGVISYQQHQMLDSDNFTYQSEDDTE